MAAKKKRKQHTAQELRGQLMLQTAAGRYFRPDVPIGEHIHRRTLYSNAWLADSEPVKLPVGTVTGGTELEEVSTAMIEAVDRLEKKRMDGTDDFHVATGGDELIDDIAYVMTFVLNLTFSRHGDQVRNLVAREGTTGRRRAGAALFPRLFDPRQVVTPEEMIEVGEFMTALLELHREDFARAMRVIRTAVDATRRAIDDPTGAYTDLVAALESLADEDLTTPTTWDRYDGRKRKILDKVLKGKDPELAEEIRQAVLEADRVGLKRRFVASTLSRISPAYYRSEAVGVLRPHSHPTSNACLALLTTSDRGAATSSKTWARKPGSSATAPTSHSSRTSSESSRSPACGAWSATSYVDTLPRHRKSTLSRGTTACPYPASSPPSSLPSTGSGRTFTPNRRSSDSTASRRRSSHGTQVITTKDSTSTRWS
jgi:hypothetical protein